MHFAFSFVVLPDENWNIAVVVICESCCPHQHCHFFGQLMCWLCCYYYYRRYLHKLYYCLYLEFANRQRFAMTTMAVAAKSKIYRAYRATHVFSVLCQCTYSPCFQVIETFEILVPQNQICQKNNY